MNAAEKYSRLLNLKAFFVRANVFTFTFSGVVRGNSWKVARPKAESSVTLILKVAVKRRCLSCRFWTFLNREKIL